MMKEVGVFLEEVIVHQQYELERYKEKDYDESL